MGVLVNGVTGIAQDSLSGIFTATATAIQSINWAELGNQVADGLSRAWGIVTGLGDIALGAGEAVIGAGQQGIAALKDWIASWRSSPEVESEAQATGKQIVTDVNTGVTGTLPDLVATAEQAGDALLNGIKGKLTADTLKAVGTDLVGGIVQGIMSVQEGAVTISGSMAQALLDAASEILTQDAGKEIGNPWAIGIGLGIQGVESALVIVTKNTGNAVINAAKNILTQAAGRAIGRTFGQGVESGIKETSGSVRTAASSLASSAASSLRSAVSSAGFPGIGRSIDEGVAQGIRNNTSIITSAAREAARAAYNAAKNELGINSPSKKGDFLGAMFALGVAGGIDENAQAVADAAANLASLAEEETAGGFGGYPTSQPQLQIDYDAIGEAVAEANRSTGLGTAVMEMDGKIVGETTEPYSSRASYHRSQKSVKGRTSRLVMA